MIGFGLIRLVELLPLVYQLTKTDAFAGQCYTNQLCCPSHFEPRFFQPLPSLERFFISAIVLIVLSKGKPIRFC